MRYQYAISTLPHQALFLRTLGRVTSNQLRLESVSGQDSDPRVPSGAAQGLLRCSRAPSAPLLPENLSIEARLPPLRPRPRGRRSGGTARRPARQDRTSGTRAAGAAPVKGTGLTPPTGSPSPRRGPPRLPALDRASPASPAPTSATGAAPHDHPRPPTAASPDDLAAILTSERRAAFWVTRPSPEGGRARQCRLSPSACALAGRGQESPRPGAGSARPFLLPPPSSPAALSRWGGEHLSPRTETAPSASAVTACPR